MHRLALQLKVALENSNYSRAEICERCDITPATLSKYINGKIQPRKNALSRLVKVIPEQFLGAVYSAYLLDLLPSGGEQYITISPKKNHSSKLKESPGQYLPRKLPHELEDAFTHLKNLTLKSPAAADFILSTSQMMQEIETDN